MNIPASKAYEGPSGIGRDSIWLTAEDLIEGRDFDVTIEKVLIYPEVTFQGGRKKTNMLGLKFVGKDRVLGLNATNRKALNKMFGNITSGWKGGVITLYVSDTQLAGETVKCLRIRSKPARAASAAEDLLGDDDDPTAEGPEEA